MDNIARINQAIAYIEAHITGDIDYAQAAKIACCPTHQFPRIFAYVADIPLNEYIRRRRLSLAAIDLQAAKCSVIDIALKYGYDSQSAFTRAFKQLHGISPSQAKKAGAPLHIVPPMSFQFPKGNYINPYHYRVEKGNVKMAELTKLEFADFGPCKVIGKAIKTKPMSNDMPRLWGQCSADGTFETLFAQKEYFPENTEPTCIGFIPEFDMETMTFTYVVGIFVTKNAPVPEGFDSFDVPACHIAKSWIKGEEYEVFSNAFNLTQQALEEKGFQVDAEHYFECEVYTDERYSIPKNKGEKVITMDYYLPCKKA